MQRNIVSSVLVLVLFFTVATLNVARADEAKSPQPAATYDYTDSYTSGDTPYTQSPAGIEKIKVFYIPRFEDGTHVGIEDAVNKWLADSKEKKYIIKSDVTGFHDMVIIVYHYMVVTQPQTSSVEKSTKK
ncbi:MAG: hypothetical protein PHF79_01190 [Candidatus Pacebacteria bacterium]|nr:hypothetical protein [Candidatus Paceibacterota bacterium]